MMKHGQFYVTCIEILMILKNRPHVQSSSITKQGEFDHEQKAGYLQKLKKPPWRRRSILIRILMFASQSTGVLRITNC